MISQAILVTVVMLMDTGRCSKPKPMPTCLTRCEDLTSPLPFGTTSYCNLDSSFLVNCNYSYKPPKPFLNLGSSISLDGKFIAVSYLASKFYDYDSLQINISISEATYSELARSQGVGTKDDSCCYPQRGTSRSILFCIYLGKFIICIFVMMHAYVKHNSHLCLFCSEKVYSRINCVPICFQNEARLSSNFLIPCRCLGSCCWSFMDNLAAQAK